MLGRDVLSCVLQVSHNARLLAAEPRPEAMLFRTGPGPGQNTGSLCEWGITHVVMSVVKICWLHVYIHLQMSFNALMRASCIAGSPRWAAYMEHSLAKLGALFSRTICTVLAGVFGPGSGRARKCVHTAQFRSIRQSVLINVGEQCGQCTQHTGHGWVTCLAPTDAREHPVLALAGALSYGPTQAMVLYLKVGFAGAWISYLLFCKNGKESHCLEKKACNRTFSWCCGFSDADHRECSVPDWLYRSVASGSFSNSKPVDTVTGLKLTLRTVAKGKGCRQHLNEHPSSLYCVLSRKERSADCFQSCA